MISPVLEHRVGPNAITQVAAAIEARCGSAMADAVFATGRALSYRLNPPREMIPQDVAIAVHKALYTVMRPHEAQSLAFEAGLRTADYLLRHRIPRFAQFLLKRAPKRWAARQLIRAIGAHAWTFTGSGAFSAHCDKDRIIIDIAHNPLATNPCDWHRGVFERLFRTLISTNACVTETACCATGADSCRFEIELHS